MTVPNKLLLSDVVVHYNETITEFEDIIKNNMLQVKVQKNN